MRSSGDERKSRRWVHWFARLGAANDSLLRANDAPEPHETSNNIFVMLYEAHWRDREALFDAMRRLDAASEKLRVMTAE